MCCTACLGLCLFCRYWGSVGSVVDFQGLRKENNWDAAMAKYNWYLSRNDSLLTGKLQMLAGSAKVRCLFLLEHGRKNDGGGRAQGRARGYAVGDRHAH